MKVRVVRVIAHELQAVQRATLGGGSPIVAAPRTWTSSAFLLVAWVGCRADALLPAVDDGGGAVDASDAGDGVNACGDAGEYAIPCAESIAAYLDAGGYYRCAPTYAGALADPSCNGSSWGACGTSVFVGMTGVDGLGGCFYDLDSGQLLAVGGGSPTGSSCLAGPPCWLWDGCSSYDAAPCADAGPASPDAGDAQAEAGND
jgi:hypothetical protein